MLRDIRLVIPRPSRSTAPTPGTPVAWPSRVTTRRTTDAWRPREIDGTQYGFGSQTPVRTLHRAIRRRNGRTFLFSRAITGASAAPEIAMAAEMRTSRVAAAYSGAGTTPPGGRLQGSSNPI